MDPVFFRGLAAALSDLLPGSRLGKAYEPAPGVYCLELSSPLGFALAPGRAPSKKAFLLWISRPGAGFVFVSPDKPGAPAKPSGKAMWLRARVSDRFITEVKADPATRTLALGLSMPAEREGRYLLLHLKGEPEIVENLPPGFGRVDPLPDLDTLLAHPRSWELHPFLGKSLAARLAGLPRSQAQAELDLLAGARGASAYFGSVDAKGFARVLAHETSTPAAERFDSVLAAAAWLGPRRVDQVVSTHVDTGRREEERRRAAKRKRLYAAISQDEKRLEALIGSHRQAEALAAHLADLGPRSHLGPLALAHPDGEVLSLPLDPALTVTANMERLFKLAAKGRRGLAHVKRRRAELGLRGAPSDAPGAASAVAAGTRPGAGADASRTKAGQGACPRAASASQARAGSASRPPAGIAARVFVTDDGLVAWRGKNAKANHDLLTKAAAPSDLWLHAEDGPGAHVILRLAGRIEAPKKSLEQAAALAALASWQKNEGKGRVMVAKVSKVRTIKGAAMGQVAVDTLVTRVIVPLDAELEKRLAADGEPVDTGTSRR